MAEKHEDNLFGKIVLGCILVTVIILVGVFIINNMATPKHYWAPGSNFAGETGAPDGEYLQKEWGWFNNETRVWYFAMCDHDYLGPLHGGWSVKEDQWIPVLGEESEGVYPIDAQLYLTLSNNTIVNVRIESAFYR